jgi:hypothetical protein
MLFAKDYIFTFAFDSPLLLLSFACYSSKARQQCKAQATVQRKDKVLGKSRK